MAEILDPVTEEVDDSLTLQLLEEEFVKIEAFLQKCKKLLRPKVTAKMYPSRSETDEVINSLQRMVDINPDIMEDVGVIAEFLKNVSERKWRKVKSTVVSACMEFDAAQIKYLLTEDVKSALDRPSSIELANFDVWKECAYLRFGADTNDDLEEVLVEDHIEHSPPTLMARQFCTIYDVEWTEAVQQVLSTFGDEQEENEMLKDVATILKNLFDFFKEKVKIQVKNMCSVMSKVALEPIPIKPKSRASKMTQPPRSSNENESGDMLIYARLAVKGSSQITVPILLKDFIAQAAKKHSVYFNLDKCSALFEKCAYFIWNINLMEPPMVLLWAEHVKSGFGTKLDFCVWPALLLQEGGQVFVRGLTQLQ